METIIGSHAWALASKGKLSWTESIKLLSSSLYPNLVQLAKTALHIGAKAPISISDINIPDSYAAKIAFDEVIECAPKSIAEHSFRTYFWAAGLASVTNIKHDAELLFVSSLLHDLGLTAKHTKHDCQCFTLASTLGAESVMHRAGWSTERTNKMSDIICMHMNGHSSLADGAETYLLQQGTAYDVIGARFHDLQKSYRDAVLQKHPRSNINFDFNVALRREAEMHPKSRAALMMLAGLPIMIKMNPYKN